MGINRFTKFKKFLVEEENFYFSFSFDIGEYDGGLCYLQIYDSNCNLVYDKPYAISISNLHQSSIRKDIRKVIKYDILYPKGFIP